MQFLQGTTEGVNMTQFLQVYFSEILSIIQTLILVLTAIYLTKVTKNPKFLEGVFDVIMTKYKTEQTVTKTKGQKFAHTVPVYELDSKTGELVKTDKLINIDELVNSSKDSALNNIYDRFLPDEQSTEMVNFDIHSDRDFQLNDLRKSFELVESYRSKYKLPADMDALDVLSYVEKSAKKAKENVDKLKEQVELKKGGVENA